MVLLRSGLLTALLITILWPLRQQQPALGAGADGGPTRYDQQIQVDADKGDANPSRRDAHPPPRPGIGD